jgi:hypothetical protein
MYFASIDHNVVIVGHSIDIDDTEFEVAELHALKYITPRRWHAQYHAEKGHLRLTPTVGTD